jgi:hypothetical protein
LGLPSLLPRTLTPPAAFQSTSAQRSFPRQALLYAVPGAALGILVAVAASVPLLNLVSEYAAVPPDAAMQLPAAATALLAGLLMPLLGNVPPLRRVLFAPLVTSLDVYHKASSLFPPSMLSASPCSPRLLSVHLYHLVSLDCCRQAY